MSANPADPLVQAGPGATHSFNENAEVIAILGHSKSLPTITSPTVVSMVLKHTVESKVLGTRGLILKY